MEEGSSGHPVGTLRPGDRSPDWQALEGLSPFGGQAVGLDIAGIRVRLEGLDEPQARWFAGRYGVFAADGGRGDASVVLALRRDPGDGHLQLDTSSGPEFYRLVLQPEQERWRAWSYRFAGWFDADRGDGLLALCDAEGRGFESSIENFLRVVYATLALGRGGFLFHAAGIVRWGRAHLLFGPSGSGKTTSCRNALDGRVLSDDLILVLPSTEGKGGPPRAVSIPFRGHQAELPRRQMSFPVAGFYRLVKDDRVFAERLATARAVAEVIASLPFVTDRPENGTAIVDAVGAALAATPAYRLHLRKDPSYWEAIERESGPAVEGRPADVEDVREGE